MTVTEGGRNPSQTMKPPVIHNSPACPSARKVYATNQATAKDSQDKGKGKEGTTSEHFTYR